MQVSHAVLHPSKQYYQLLIRFTLFMTLCLVACGLWAILVHSDNSKSVGDNLSGPLNNAGAYYDAVQGAAGIVKLEFRPHTAGTAPACDTGKSDNPP